MDELERRIFLLRHGQSTFNAHFDATGEDPGHIDAALTNFGVGQVVARRQEVHALRPDVVITSPATRALQTTVLLFEETECPPVVVESVGRDRFAGDSCDYGQPPSVLEAAFPGLDFSSVAARWWLPEAAADCTDYQESIADFTLRARSFGQWLLARPERKILVGHSGTFKVLTGDLFENCELREWRPHDRARVRAEVQPRSPIR